MNPSKNKDTVRKELFLCVQSNGMGIDIRQDLLFDSLLYCHH
jgi:hypothetical protein